MKRGRKPKTKDAQPQLPGADKSELNSTNQAFAQGQQQQQVVHNTKFGPRSTTAPFTKAKEFQHLYTLPKNTVVKFFTEQLAASKDYDVRLAATSQDLLVSLTTAFLDHVADEANVVCQEAGRACIIPDHVIDAMTRMQLSEYLTTMSEGAVNKELCDEEESSGSGKAMQSASKLRSKNTGQSAASALTQNSPLRSRILDRMNNSFASQKPSRPKPNSNFPDDSDSFDGPPLSKEDLVKQQQQFLYDANIQFQQDSMNPVAGPCHGQPQSTKSVPMDHSYEQMASSKSQSNILMPVVNVTNLPEQILDDQMPDDYFALIEQTDFCAEENEPMKEDNGENDKEFWLQFSSKGETLEFPPVDAQMATDLELMQFASLNLEGPASLEAPTAANQSTQQVPASPQKRSGAPTNNKSNRKKHAKL